MVGPPPCHNSDTFPNYLYELHVVTERNELGFHADTPLLTMLPLLATGLPGILAADHGSSDRVGKRQRDAREHHSRSQILRGTF